MDPSKKSTKVTFLPPGMLGKSRKKSKLPFGLPKCFSTVGNGGSPATNVPLMSSTSGNGGSPAIDVSNSMSLAVGNGGSSTKNVSNLMSSAVSLSQNHEEVVTTKPTNGANLEDKWSVKETLKDLFAAGYQIEDVIEALGPELGKSINPNFEEFVSSISEDKSTKQGGASNMEEEESALASENTSIPHVDSDKPVTTKRKRITTPRGVNMCTKVAKLEGENKLQVKFVNNVAVGPNACVMVRHMGRLIRDRNLIPRRILSWEDLKDLERVKRHLWKALIDKFDGEDIDLQRDSILEHMKRLWQNWRGLIKRDHIDKKGTFEDALKEVPNHLDEEEWEWLVKEHYMSDEFKKISARNSKNRGGLKMMHRTGSKSIQDVVWSEMGGKDGNQPSISEIFRRTRIKKKKNETLDVEETLDEEETLKYDEICEVEKDESLSRFDVIEKCFGEQAHSHVVCYGRGTKPKDVRGSLPSREELTRGLRDKEKENRMLIQRLDELEESRKREREFYDEKVKLLETTMLEKNADVENKLQILMALLAKQP